MLEDNESPLLAVTRNAPCQFLHSFRSVYFSKSMAHYCHSVSSKRKFVPSYILEIPEDIPVWLTVLDEVVVDVETDINSVNN